METRGGANSCMDWGCVRFIDRFIFVLPSCPAKRWQVVGAVLCCAVL